MIYAHLLTLRLLVDNSKRHYKAHHGGQYLQRDLYYYYCDVQPERTTGHDHNHLALTRRGLVRVLHAPLLLVARKYIRRSVVQQLEKPSI